MNATLVVPLYSATTLGEFETALRAADPKNPEQFRELLNTGIDLLRLLHEDVADKCDASRPTVTRWVNGQNAPTPTVRKAVYRYLLARTGSIKRRLREQELRDRQAQQVQTRHVSEQAQANMAA